MFHGYYGYFSDRLAIKMVASKVGLYFILNEFHKKIGRYLQKFAVAF